MNIQIGYDDNLGLPKDFATTFHCEIAPYHDLGKMITAFEN
jgi:hypothetical protein